MSTVIRVENLAKSYMISHERRDPYATLRDVIATKVKNLFSGRGSDLTQEEFWALKDINFEIKQNDRIGIIGRNGAGKSTLLKILSRITEPTRGRVSIKGRVASLLEVGTGFHPELTGRENIFLNGAILGMRKTEIDRKFDEIVSFAEIEKFVDTPVKRYSSGMYVRLAFAVAAQLEPEILIVDEVLAVGDIVFQNKCLGKMENISKEGRTVIFVSHNIEAIQKLCNRGIILHEGKVAMQGDVDQVVNKYLGEGLGLIGEQVWQDIQKAPGDQVVKMVAVRVLDKNDNVCTKFDVRDPVTIELEYHILEAGHRLCTQIYFVNELGHVLFISKDNLDSPWKNTGCSVGHFKSHCHVPGDFLNEGEVSIVYGIDTVGSSLVNHATDRDVVRFRVTDHMDPRGVRGNYPLTWRHDGVRPRLQWTVEKSIQF